MRSDYAMIGVEARGGDPAKDAAKLRLGAMHALAAFAAVGIEVDPDARARIPAGDVVRACAGERGRTIDGARLLAIALRALDHRADAVLVRKPLRGRGGQAYEGARTDAAFFGLRAVKDVAVADAGAPSPDAPGTDLGWAFALDPWFERAATTLRAAGAPAPRTADLVEAIPLGASVMMAEHGYAASLLELLAVDAGSVRAAGARLRGVARDAAGRHRIRRLGCAWSTHGRDAGWDATVDAAEREVHDRRALPRDARIAEAILRLAGPDACAEGAGAVEAVLAAADRVAEVAGGDRVAARRMRLSEMAEALVASLRHAPQAWRRLPNGEIDGYAGGPCRDDLGG